MGIVEALNYELYANANGKASLQNARNSLMIIRP